VWVKFTGWVFAQAKEFLGIPGEAHCRNCIINQLLIAYFVMFSMLAYFLFVQLVHFTAIFANNQSKNGKSTKIQNIPAFLGER